MFENLRNRLSLSSGWLFAAAATFLALLVFGSYLAFRPDPCRADNTGAFDGETLYSCLVQTVKERHLNLTDTKARSAWINEWEDKYDGTDLLETKEGTLKAITEMLLSVHGRFDYVFAPEQAAQNAVIENGGLAGIGITIGISGEKESRPPANLDLPEHTSPQLRALLKSRMGPQENDTVIDAKHQLTVMANPEEGTPAFNAGIKAGDALVAVNGQELNGKKASSVVEQMRGAVGTPVELTIMRDGVKKTMHVIRAMISLRIVSQRTIEDIGYLKIGHFESLQAVEQVHQALDSLCRSSSQQDCDLKALIVDLRDNPGGQMNGVLGISEFFIEDGNLTTIMERSGNGFSRVDIGLMAASVITREGNSINIRQRDFAVEFPVGRPIIVLVNENSASGAEMLAAILKQERGAIVVGSQTRGKGVGQCTIPLPFGYVANIVCLEYLAGGQAVDWVGVIPDVSITQMPNASTDDQLSEAITKAKELIAKAKSLRDAQEQSMQERHRLYDKEVEYTQNRFLR